MKKIISGLMLAGALVLAASPVVMAAKEKTPAVERMSREDLIKTARSAAPESISENATILLPTRDGGFTEAVKGTNEFTCIPDLSRQEKADPFCGDRAATQWAIDLLAKKDKPSNTEPGVGYMMKGGYHWEKDGAVVSAETPGAKRVEETAHWMILWPFEVASTGLPTKDSKFGSYIMYEGTPYAHLMVHEHPKHLK